jgi:hypothetical protein
VRLHAPDIEDRLKRKKHDLQQREVSRLIYDLKTDKGTDRDKLIIGLFNSITIQPGEHGPSERDLSLKEFQGLQSKVERLTDEEIGEEIHKQEVEKEQKIEEARKNGKILTLDLPTLAHWQPNLPDHFLDSDIDDNDN